MSIPLNQVNLGGKVVSEITLRTTNNKGIPVCNFRLSHNAPKLRNPVYIDVEVWGKEAEIFAEKASRHSLVVVYGEIRRDVWQTESGEPRSKLKITASRIVLDETHAITGDRARPSDDANVSF